MNENTRKYSVPVIDQAHFLLQTAGGAMIGYFIYYVVFGIAQQFAYDAFMNSSAKEYEPSLAMTIFTNLLSFLCYYAIPVLFQGWFVNIKGGDHYEKTDEEYRWLKKGLEYTLPGAVIYAAVMIVYYMIGLGVLCIPPMQITVLIQLLLPLPTVPGYVLCTLLYLAAHTCVLLLVYRRAWFGWKAETETGRVTMNLDDVADYRPKK